MSDRGYSGAIIEGLSAGGPALLYWIGDVPFDAVVFWYFGVTILMLHSIARRTEAIQKETEP